jgi:hypothetical protein
MTGTIRVIFAVLSLVSGGPAMAAELTPWFGSADQTAFQLDPNTMVAVTFAADPLQTGSLSTAQCPSKGCAPTPDAARDRPLVAGVPQK